MYRQRTLLGVFLAYLAFVVYGSLLPFELRLDSIEQGLEQFSRIRWLDLGAASRADWVANLVLYVPLAFLGCSALAGYARTAAARSVLVLAVVIFSLLIAVAVEFTQVFFAPRTVSLNDLLAEALGTFIGVGLWIGGRDQLSRLGRDFRSGGRRSLAASISAYLALYIALALFPFDFVISWNELLNRLESGNIGLIFAGQHATPLRTAANLIGESLAAAPLGLFAALLVRRISIGRAFIAGAILGTVLELAQLLLVSGVTQGASILARGLGLAAGAMVGREIQDKGLLPVARWVEKLAVPLFPIYLIAVLMVSGWFSRDTLSTAEALSRFDSVQLIPFYFHYFTTEPVAMASLLANLAMYAPVGLYIWARQVTMPRLAEFGLVYAATAAVLLAFPVEASKLWLVGKHPDFTNLLIGAAGASLSYLLAIWVSRASAPSIRERVPSIYESALHNNAHVAKAEPQTGAIGAARSKGVRPASAQFTMPKIIAAVFFVIFGIGLVLHPLAFPWVALIVIAYAILCWRFPWGWLFLIPMLLPVLDLAPLSGRLLLDEFDLVILLTLGIGYWRYLSYEPVAWPNETYRYAVALLLVSALISTTLGLRPLLDGAPASLASSHSALEALLVGKGLFWALLLIPLLRRIPIEELERARDRLIAGLAAGLTLLSLAVLLERHRFVGLGDFDGIFRVTGTLSAMNNGGAYIEAFIAISFPALVVWTLQQPKLILRLAGVIAAALATYAMFVTFSRGGYAGLVVGLGLVVGFSLWRPSARTGRNQGIWLAGTIVVALAVATPILLGGFAQGRLAQIEKDLLVRLDHWGSALGLMEPGLVPAVIGMGFGRYPAVYLWHSDGARRPGTYVLEREGDKTFLRLGSGEAYYLDQIVHVDRSKPHTLHARIRFHGAEQHLRVLLCEKALLYSFRCNTHAFRPAELDRSEGWHELTRTLNTAGLGNTGRWPEPTLKLSIASPTSEGAVDIAVIRLHDSDGRELLVNGGFENGLAGWLVTTDGRLAWHIDQSFIEIYFSQGALGIVAVLLALFATTRVLLPRMRYGEPFAIAIGAGLAGFVTVGLLGSTMDTARTILIFYLLSLGSAALSANRLPAKHQGATK